jgi:hypothetical protein
MNRAVLDRSPRAFRDSRSCSLVLALALAFSAATAALADESPPPETSTQPATDALPDLVPLPPQPTGVA